MQPEFAEKEAHSAALGRKEPYDGRIGEVKNHLSATQQATNGRILNTLGDPVIKPEADYSSSKRDVSRKQWLCPKPLRGLLKGLWVREAEPAPRRWRTTRGRFT